MTPRRRVGPFQSAGTAMSLAVVLAAGLAGLVACADGGEAAPGLSEERLSVLIDSLLPGIAEASGLEVRRPVRYALQSKSKARSFIEAQLDEEMAPGELAGMERAYKLMGLLPDTLELRALMLALLTEQVVGYYDPATDRLYLVEGVPAATAAPVVAHELVHALQDQWTDLDSLVAAERGNDRQTAAHAAAEGQAMLVMLAMQAAQASGEKLDPAALPDLGTMLRPALEEESSGFPVFERSPRLIRETLLFPYTGGASFVQALFRHSSNGGVPVPFGDLLPQSTEQVMEPERAFLEGRDAPTEIELGAPGAGWEVVYSNTLGQLEAGIFLQERTGSATASASGWDGDRYALLEGPGGAEALVWYSVWDDQAAADRVVRALRSAPGGISAEPLAVAGRPVVRAVLTPGGVDPGDALPSIARLEEVAAR